MTSGERNQYFRLKVKECLATTNFVGNPPEFVRLHHTKEDYDHVLATEPASHLSTHLSVKKRRRAITNAEKVAASRSYTSSTVPKLSGKARRQRFL